MLNMTNKDDIYLHTNNADIIKIIGILFMHFAVALIFISFIVDFVLRGAFIAGMIATVLIASAILTSAIHITLRWLWDRITVNGKKCQFVGEAYPLFGMVLLIAVMIIVAVVMLGIGVLLLMGSSYVWWQLMMVAVCLTAMVSCLLCVVRYMKKWANAHVKERIE